MDVGWLGAAVGRGLVGALFDDSRRSMGSLMQKREERGEVRAHKSEVSTYSEMVQRPFKQS